MVPFFEDSLFYGGVLRNAHKVFNKSKNMGFVVVSEVCLLGKLFSER